ncbi:hypothetical protein [Streptomyces flavofungini]|uniref:hypothetical protein n=1 Tax=Streptomyces flavofungini TaxID=68200 RepID=UPI0025B0ED89|nr:hypothetical protein [Streptomyces flavofungini]WJV47648.1 hypothetical protein QUY26_20240 [Streptomyces flavofungini]
MEPTRTDWLVGQFDAVAVAAAYACGHCNSTTEIHTVDGVLRVAVHHDDECLVLNGVLPSAPDVMRAFASSVPDTSHP